MSVSAQLDRTGSAGPPSAGPDPLAFRAVCGTFATGVTVVTADAPDGPRGGTVNSFTSLSTEPPQVIVCLAKSSRTWQAVEASGAFAVNILSADQQQVARLFASREPAKMARAAWTSGRNGAPVLDGAAGAIECTLSAALEQATHMLVIGSVTAATHRPDADPLIFFRSTLHEGLGRTGGPAPHAALAPSA
jgi:3-hydroxy-9,10-secoandrosta-1,3,5(10)-triene-9,17-dione monooxygenase reductase component